MVFLKYSKDVEVLAVKMCLRGLDLEEINQQMDMSISYDSLWRWQLLYQQTLQVVCNPALYERRGRTVVVTR
jgi:hypothetical protein